MRENRHINVLKGLGIFFVVAGHSGSCLTSFYYTFHMGLLFMISGWLLSEKAHEKASVFVKKRIRGVLVPYSVFFAVSIIYAELAAAWDGGFFPLTVNHLKAFALGGTYLSQYTVNLPLWYLFLYFIASIIYFLLLRLSDRAKAVTAVILIFVTIPFQNLLPDRPILFVNILPPALVYMLFGYAVKRIVQERGNIQAGAVLVFVGWYSSLIRGGGIDIAHITDNIYYVESFCTIMGLYLLAFKMRPSKMLEYIGKRSLYILGLHSLIANQVIRLSDFISAVLFIENPYIGSLLFTVIIIILCCALADIYSQVKTFLMIKRRSKCFHWKK